MDAFIEFCNLKRHYENRREEYLAAFDAVCSKAAFIDGDYVKTFERAFAKDCETSYASCVNSGTNALLLATLAMGMSAGDEVIIPTNTFVATAWGPVYAGAKPVFVDCKSDTWNIDPEVVEAAITDKTKAIIGVHLYGQPFDADAIQAIADKHGLLVIEDCAQAHGAVYKNRPVGGLCDIGCFSFYPTKNLGAFGEGGCVTTNSADFARRIDSLKNHAINEAGDHESIGFNMRMDGIQAAVLNLKLETLPTLNARRAQIAARYKEEITNPCIGFQAVSAFGDHVYHLFVITVPERDKFIEYMKENRIGCGVHYRVPCHLQTVFAPLGYKPGDLPNAEYLAAHCVSLPLYPDLYEDEVNRVIEACNRYTGGLEG